MVAPSLQQVYLVMPAKPFNRWQLKSLVDISGGLALIVSEEFGVAPIVSETFAMWGIRFAQHLRGLKH